MISILLNLDKLLFQLVEQYGNLSYLILFLVVFLESGVVFFSFLPGDGLLFGAGIIVSESSLNGVFLGLLFLAAAFLGNLLNYYFGKTFGNWLLKRNIIGLEQLQKGLTFYSKHGDKAILLSRFMPYIRSFVPFIAGITKMNKDSFVRFSFWGATFWILIFMGVGFLLGHIPEVRDHFTWIVFGMMALSWIPLIFAFFKLVFQNKSTRSS